MKYVDLETARQSRGLRLVVLASVPSAWSEAAKGIFHVKGIDFVAVRCDLRDQAIRAWTGVHNAPVALFDDEPPRSHWSDILALAERLDQATPLVPADPEARLRVLGLAHEICGEGGLLWSGRLLLLDRSIQSNGERGFPMPVAQHLTRKYGYPQGGVDQARRRVSEIFAMLAAELERNRVAGSAYLIGNRLSAVDIYTATALWTFAPLTDEQCPIAPHVRRMFAPLADEVREHLPPDLLAHREFIYQRHLELPVAL